MEEDYYTTLLDQKPSAKSRESKGDLPAGAPIFPMLSVKIWRPSELVTIWLVRGERSERGWKIRGIWTKARVMGSV